MKEIEYGSNKDEFNSCFNCGHLLLSCLCTESQLQNGGHRMKKKLLELQK